jgi:hypothetical protein
VEQAMACVDFKQSAIGPLCPLAGSPRALVCLAGSGQLQHAKARYDFSRGNALLMPAALGTYSCLPRGLISVLEISLPELR